LSKQTTVKDCLGQLVHLGQSHCTTVRKHHNRVRLGRHHRPQYVELLFGQIDIVSV
jgi:hypothetical protein